MADERYKVIRLLDAEPERIENKMNQMDEEGYRFVQMETVYGCSRGAMLTVLVFEKEREVAVTNTHRYTVTDVRWDDAMVLEGLDASDDRVPVGDPLLEGLRR